MAILIRTAANFIFCMCLQYRQLRRFLFLLSWAKQSVPWEIYDGSSNIWLTCFLLSTNPFFPHTGVRTIQKAMVFLQAVFQSPTPHSPRGFAARLLAPPPKLYFVCAYNTASYAGYECAGKLLNSLILKKWGKTLKCVSCFHLHALPLPACFTTEQSTVKASLFVN